MNRLQLLISVQLIVVGGRLRGGEENGRTDSTGETTPLVRGWTDASITEVGH